MGLCKREGSLFFRGEQELFGCTKMTVAGSIVGGGEERFGLIEGFRGKKWGFGDGGRGDNTPHLVEIMHRIASAAGKECGGKKQ